MYVSNYLCMLLIRSKQQRHFHVQLAREEDKILIYWSYDSYVHNKSFCILVYAVHSFSYFLSYSRLFLYALSDKLLHTYK